ncbi:3-isopropylmalate dehydratase small subunit [Hyphomonas johnsonii]|uniref:3-isopropylmalate dehydratase n=1 Tax=Hyphomonas johnsonii MHS-2 TaxID=1280950 RepID=A0A059FG82_9PROT|nr:3-isopropylmalate dehydratase small subunit [Hyphomonas johnsonii]KCZ89526.1 3-isopropylmalate dehydratase small subunit [Hyphomonas johnsonii MHS-2]
MNRQITRLQGITACLPFDNIDTDQIIPSREMKSTSKTDLAAGLFAGWRYVSAESRQCDPDFVLNQARCDGASILVSRSNFGCGSSREHAVWALREFGFRCIVAASFSQIFFRNCINNGILPVVLPAAAIGQIEALFAHDNSVLQLVVDLPEQAISPAGAASVWAFDIEASDKAALMTGRDPIAVTLESDSDIRAFIARDLERRPWIYSQARSGT